MSPRKQTATTGQSAEIAERMEAAMMDSTFPPTHEDDRRGRTGGTTFRLARSWRRNRKATGYFSGSTFSAGSVDLQA